MKSKNITVGFLISLIFTPFLSSSEKVVQEVTIATQPKTVKVADIQEVFKVPFVIADSKHIVIWDQQLRKIHVYQKGDYKKLKTFGRHGRGPGEFFTISRVSVSDDYIYVSSYPKFCIFSKDGELDKEIRGPINAGSFIYMDGNFIGTSYLRSKPDEITFIRRFSLYSSELEKQADICLVECPKSTYYKNGREKLLFIGSQTKADVCGDKIIIGEPYKEFIFTVYNRKGERLYEIKKEPEKRKITEEEKQEMISESIEYLGENEWKKRKLMYDLFFPEMYPAFQNFIVDSQKIYVFGFKRNQKRDVCILDLKGKLLSRKTIPSEELPGTFEHTRFDIFSGKLFYMNENEDTETWELHAVDLEK